MINSLDILKDKVQELESGAVLFSTLGTFHYFPILYKIIKCRKDLIWIGRITKSIPLASSKSSNPLKSVLRNIFFYNLYRPFSNVMLYVVQKAIRKYGQVVGLKAYQPDYLMVTNIEQVPSSYPKERVILTHADDYNIHLLKKDIELDLSLQDAIVFLDQMIYYHSDLKNLRADDKDVDRYYQKLNKLLDDVSQKYGKPVVIAGHPEAEKYPHYQERFKGKKLVTGKSLNLVKHAALVMTHYSGAVNFAVIYKKPLLMVSSRGFEPYENIMRSIRTLSKELNVKVINIDNYDLQEIDLSLKPNYNTYRNQYIKSDNTPDELSYPYAVSYALNQVKAKEAH